MTPAEAKREQRRNAISHAIPDWEALTEGYIEQCELPAEYAEHGFDDTHEVACHIEEQVIEDIMAEAPPEGHKDAGFFQEEADAADCYVFDKVMDEFVSPEEQPE
jgi:hypothetical protein